MGTLKKYLEDNIVPRQVAIHDLTDNRPTLTLTPGDGWVEYVNNGLGYNYHNGEALFNTATGIIKDHIVDAKLDVILTSQLNFTANVDYLEVKLEIQNPAKYIIQTHTIAPIKQGNIVDVCILWNIYTGELVEQYGAKVFTRVVGGNIEISNRRTLIRS